MYTIWVAGCALLAGRSTGIGLTSQNLRKETKREVLVQFLLFPRVLGPVLAPFSLSDRYGPSRLQPAFPGPKGEWQVMPGYTLFIRSFEQVYSGYSWFILVIPVPKRLFPGAIP